MVEFNKVTRETYNTVSRNWDSKRQYAWRPITDFLSSFDNSSNLKLLDLGCGAGRNLDFAVKHGFDKKNLIGCDYSSGQLEIVKEKGFEINLSDLKKLNFSDSVFDVVICIAAHHHLLEREEQLKSLVEMNRVLKNDGTILISNWFAEEKFIEEQEKKGKFEFIDKKRQKVRVTYDFEGKKYDRFYYLFKEDELKELCFEAGFKIIKEEYDKGNFYLTLKKKLN